MGVGTTLSSGRVFFAGSRLETITVGLIFVVGAGLFYAKAVELGAWGCWHPFDLNASGVRFKGKIDFPAMARSFYFLAVPLVLGLCGVFFLAKYPMPRGVWTGGVTAATAMLVADLLILSPKSQIFVSSLCLHTLCLLLFFRFPFRREDG